MIVIREIANRPMDTHDDRAPTIRMMYEAELEIGIIEMVPTPHQL